jgi:hypothetical protein
MGSVAGGITLTDYGTHYHAIKDARRYDLWRREMGFDSFDALIESFTEAAKLLDQPVAQYIHDCFNTWDGDNK